MARPPSYSAPRWLRILPVDSRERNRWVARRRGDDMHDRIERELLVPAPVDDVWPAVSEPGELSEWFGAEVELDVRPGGRGTFRWPDGTERGAVVEEVDAPRRLAFRWLPFERSTDGTHAVKQTRVEIELEPVAD